MTILGALTRSINDPTVPLTSASLADFLSGGRTKAGALVSEDRVLGLPAYHRGVTIKASVMAMLPVKIYERQTRKRFTGRTVLDAPNPRQTPFAYRQTMYANAISHGNGFARKYRNGADIVVETWPIHPSRVRVEAVDPTEQDPAGKLFIVRMKNGREERFTSWEIFHLPFMSPDGLLGLSALRAFRESLGVAIAAEDAAGSLFANGSRLTGILKFKDEASEGQVKRTRARWRQITGAESAGDIAILDNGADFQSVTIPPHEAQLLASRQWSVTEMSRMVGLPPHLIGDVSGSTSWGSGIEQQFTSWVQIDIGPWAKNAEELYTAELLPGGRDNGSWYAEHVLDGLLRGDTAARAAYYHEQHSDGLASKNELRGLENREPVEGGDEFMLPAGVMPESLATLKTKVEALGALVRAGFDPDAAAAAVGLDPITHTGLVPVTVTVDPAAITSGGSNAPTAP